MNGKLALLVLGMLEAAAAKAEPDRVQVQFALIGGRGSESDPGDS